MSRLLCAICLAAAVVGCSEPAGPKQPPGIRFLAPASLQDSVMAILPVTIQVTGDDGRPLAAAYVEFRAGPDGLFLGNAVIDSGGGALVTRATELRVRADARGIASAYVQLGSVAGESLLRVIATVSTPADGTTVALFADSLRFDVVPGAITSIVAVPADTAVAAGETYAIAAYAADRYDNRRPELASDITAHALNPAVALSDGASVTSVAHGRAAIELSAPFGSTTAYVSVVPRARIAAGQNDGAATGRLGNFGNLVFVDVDTGHLESLLQGDTVTCPRWHPSGDRVLLSRLRIVSRTGVVSELSTGSALAAGCGEFTRDGEWIFFAGRSASQQAAQVWRIRADGSGLQQITSDDGTDYRHMVSPSPDGSRLAYASTNAFRTVVVAHTLATGQVDTLVSVLENWSQGTGVSSVQWSPTGEQIAYTLRDTGLWHTYGSHQRFGWVYGSRATLVRADNPAIRHTLPAGAAFLEGVTWSPDGAWLIGKAFRDWRLILVHVETGAVLPLHGSTRTMHSAAWRPSP